MKISQKIGLSLAIVAAISFIVYITSDRNRRSEAKRMLNQIAEEGYETAQDVLFPGKKIQDKNLRFGPVIPGMF